MLFDPSKRFNLVQKARVKVAERRVGAEDRMGEETEGFEAIVNRYDDDVGRLVDPVLEWPIARVSEDVTYAKSNRRLSSLT